MYKGNGFATAVRIPVMTTPQRLFINTCCWTPGGKELGTWMSVIYNGRTYTAEVYDQNRTQKGYEDFAARTVS